MQRSCWQRSAHGAPKRRTHASKSLKRDVAKPCAFEQFIQKHVIFQAASGRKDGLESTAAKSD
ncbi:MAG TPA: hypothetical protein VN689_14185, partial [Burkholderiales bacterium]|nr:hypothetical protein [Burkholderiales bacterium]